MTPTVVARLDDITRDEWLRLRRNGIGGSDAAAVCGLDPWSSPFAVYQSKVSDAPDVDNDAMAWGRRLEHVVADHFAGLHPEIGVTDAREMYAHPDRPWQQATPDRILEHPTDGFGLLEVKTTSWRRADEWAGGKIPDGAALQTHHYLAVMGFDWAWVVVLVDGRTYHEVRVERDPDLIARLTAIEERFWVDHVAAGNPPPVDGHPSTTAAIAALYTAPVLDAVELDLDIVLALDEINDLKAQEKALRDRRVERENRVKAALGDAEAGTVDGEVAVTWTLVPEAEVPATTRKAHRRLTVKKRKDR